MTRSFISLRRPVCHLTQQARDSRAEACPPTPTAQLRGRYCDSLCQLDGDLSVVFILAGHRLEGGLTFVLGLREPLRLMAMISRAASSNFSLHFISSAFASFY